MRELWFWRAVAVVAIVGWVVTAWREEPAAGTSTPLEQPARTREPRPSAGAAVAPAGAAPVRPSRPAEGAVTPPVGGAPLAPGLSEEALAVAREEVRAELTARREAHEEERLSDFLDRAEAFARDHDLRPDQTERLVATVTAMHERMRALHGDPLAEDGPPPDDRRAMMRASFEQMDAELRAALGEELADAFHQSMGPPGPPPPGR